MYETSGEPIINLQTTEDMNIPVFSFNTKQNGYIILKDTTLEEIKAELKKKFPLWSDSAVEKIATNQNFYKENIPTEESKVKKTKRGSHSTKDIISVNGFELNPLLRLASSVHAFKKNSYRYWGTVVNNVFSNPNVNQKFETFEAEYAKATKVVKKVNITKQELIRSVMTLCDKMSDIKASIVKTEVLTNDADKEYVTSTGKRLGLAELVNRIDEEVDNFKSAVGNN